VIEVVAMFKKYSTLLYKGYIMLLFYRNRLFLIIKFFLITAWGSMSSPVYAAAHYHVNPHHPNQGTLSLPLLSIGGVTSVRDVTLELDLSQQRILALNVGGTAAAHLLHTAGDYVAYNAVQGILHVPQLSVDTQLLYRHIFIQLDFNAMRFNIVTAKPGLGVMLGAYTGQYTGDVAVVDAEFNQMADWAGKRLSLGGMFIDLETYNPGVSLVAALELLRQNDYTPFVNLASWRSAEEINRGTIDVALHELGRAFAHWLQGGEARWVWIAPLPEMNGTWETYTTDPDTFKRAFARIQSIFRQEGVGQGARWVFAPNGWSWPERNFEFFYPGDEHIDAVGFSGYNRGYCTYFPYPRWETPEQVFGEYLRRMRAMAPNKAIIITQMASSSDHAPGQKSEAAKDAWLREAYAYLARFDGVAGMMYFNIDKECDWAYHRPDGGMKSNGYLEAVRDPLYEHVPMRMMEMW
jgi:hypothetical protein